MTPGEDSPRSAWDTDALRGGAPSPRGSEISSHGEGRSFPGGPGGITQAQRTKLAQRLSLAPDRTDHGHVLARTQAALALASLSANEQADRAAALACALGEERLVVPVPVEVHPDKSGHHRPQGLGEDDEIPLPLVRGPFASAVLAFTSTEELAAWDRSARPMTMSAQRVAVAATQAGAPPSIVVNPASEAPVVLPVGAVHALIGGDTWLPPWKDPSLAADLLALARHQCADVVAVRVTPTATDERWNGDITVAVLFRMNTGVDLGTQRTRLAHALAALGASARLAAAAPSVSLTPTPVTVG